MYSPLIDSGEPAPDSLPFTVAAPPRPWYKKPLTWVAVGAALIGIAVALMFTVGRPGAAQLSPSAELGHDGYSVLIPSMTPAQIGQFEQLGGGSASDQGQINAMCTGGAIGMQGSNMEIVLSLTPAGKAMIGADLTSGGAGLPQGVSAHMDGSNVVISGPASAFGSTGNSAQGA